MAGPATQPAVVKVAVNGSAGADVEFELPFPCKKIMVRPLTADLWIGWVAGGIAAENRLTVDAGLYYYNDHIGGNPTMYLRSAGAAQDVQIETWQG